MCGFVEGSCQNGEDFELGECDPTLLLALNSHRLLDLKLYDRLLQTNHRLRRPGHLNHLLQEVGEIIHQGLYGE